MINLIMFSEQVFEENSFRTKRKCLNKHQKNEGNTGNRTQNPLNGRLDFWSICAGKLSRLLIRVVDESVSLKILSRCTGLTKSLIKDTYENDRNDRLDMWMSCWNMSWFYILNVRVVFLLFRKTNQAQVLKMKPSKTTLFLRRLVVVFDCCSCFRFQ